MPIYGYRCEQCGHEFEVTQSVAETPLRECPRCMGPLRKIVYPVGVIYKGTGFYTTDYKSNSSGSRSESTAGSKPESGGEKGGASAGSDGSGPSSMADTGGSGAAKTPDKAAS